MGKFIASSIIVTVALLAGGQTQAQNAGDPADLSAREKSAIGSILDSLTTKSGSDLESSIVKDIDGLGDARSAEAVVRAVKLGAGQKLQKLEGILVSRCLGVGGSGYCKLAALQVPNQDRNSIKTSSTSAGEGGAGGGGGYGGGAQSNFNHNYANPSYASGPVNSSDTQSNQNLGRFNPGFSTLAYSATRRAAATRTVTTVAVPGPQAGTGLPFIVIAAATAFYAMKRRRLR